MNALKARQQRAEEERRARAADKNKNARDRKVIPR